MLKYRGSTSKQLILEIWCQNQRVLLILRCHNTEISQTMWSDQGKAQYLIRNLTPKLKGFPHPRGTIHGPITTEWVRSRGGPANLCQNERVLLVSVRGTTCTIYRSITNNVVRSRKGPVSYYSNNQIKGFSSPQGSHTQVVRSRGGPG